MTQNPDPHAPLAAQRSDAHRLDALVADLLPKIRILSPTLSEEEVQVAARRMAIYRLDDDLGGWGER